MTELVARNVRTQDISSTGLEMGMQVWRDTNRNLLGARAREAVKRGEIAIVHGISPRPNRYQQYRMVVKVLKQPRSKLPLRALLAAGGVSLTSGVMVLLYASRWVLLAAAAMLLLAWLAMRIGTGHSGTCVGLHCAGCGR